VVLMLLHPHVTPKPDSRTYVTEEVVGPARWSPCFFIKKLWQRRLRQTAVPRPLLLLPRHTQQLLGHFACAPLDCEALTAQRCADLLDRSDATLASSLACSARVWRDHHATHLGVACPWVDRERRAEGGSCAAWPVPRSRWRGAGAGAGGWRCPLWEAAQPMR
jgi:hypothetical protein